jgi:heme exporter protein B
VTGFLRKAWAIVWKDLVAEWRSKDALGAMFIFAVISLMIFNFALDLSSVETRIVAPGILWVAFIFAGILGLNRSFSREKDQGNLEGLMLAPVDRSAIYVGKLLSTLVILFAVEAITLPLFAALFNVALPVFALLVPLVLGSVGFAVVGTIFAAMAVNTRLRDVLLPLLLLPILVPVVIAAVKASGAVVNGQSLIVDAGHWVGLLVAFDVIFLTASLLLFEFVLEE